MGKPFAMILLLLSVGAHLVAQEPSLEEPRDWPEPDHLVPLRPYSADWEKPYIDLWHEKLQVPDQYLAVMVRRPSFDPESCLAIVQREEGPATYAIALTRSNTNLWYWMHSVARGELRKAIEGKRFEATLPPELAGRVLKLWERMLGNVRYPKPEDETGGADGETIEFRHNPSYSAARYGETWSPSRGAPKLFVDLGASLADYCEANADERPQLSETIIRRCEALEKRLARK